MTPILPLHGQRCFNSAIGKQNTLKTLKDYGFWLNYIFQTGQNSLIAKDIIWEFLNVRLRIK